METAETTGNPAQMKRMNIESVYRALIDYKAATRAEIAERTKISITTIRALMEELRAKEEIIEASIDASSGGRRAIRYTLNPKKNQILSVFYTDNEVFYEIAALDGQIIQRNRIEKSVYESEQSLFDVMDIHSSEAHKCPGFSVQPYSDLGNTVSTAAYTSPPVTPRPTVSYQVAAAAKYGRAITST